MDEMNQLKVFTVEEANQMIPKLTGQIIELQKRQREILNKEVEIDTLEHLHPESEEEGPSPEAEQQIGIYNKLVSQCYELIDQIQGQGCFLKDAEAGLVDFYTLYQGRVVYLCWKLGEERVDHWHEVGRGYTYRQPIIQEDEKESSG